MRLAESRINILYIYHENRNRKKKAVVVCPQTGTEKLAVFKPQFNWHNYLRMLVIAYSSLRTLFLVNVSVCAWTQVICDC